MRGRFRRVLRRGQHKIGGVRTDHGVCQKEKLEMEEKRRRKDNSTKDYRKKKNLAAGQHREVRQGRNRQERGKWKTLGQQQSAPRREA